MILNFGHTFAHAIEAKNKFSGKINHGEAVLMGMMIAANFHFLKKLCSNNVNNLMHIYKKNNLINKFKRHFLKRKILIK